ncbi:MAG: PilN domain-containing protein [Candidatus Omnitrophica bacterium]|nr:PilN domain-containing protein [Candidatus Omnitrophota bacterium]
MKRGVEWIAVDIGEQYFFLAHVQAAGGKHSVRHLFFYPVKKGAAEEEIAAMIRTTVTGLRLQTRPRVVAVVPLSHTITRNLEIPSLDPREIKEIIDLQAGRHTPYSREEIIVDHLPLGMYRQNYTRILLVIVNRAVVRRYLSILEKTALAPEQLLFAPEAMSALATQQLKPAQRRQPAAVLHLDARGGDFFVAIRGMPVFSRHIPAVLPTAAEAYNSFFEKLGEEVKRSLDTYQSEEIDRVPVQMLVCGALDALPADTAARLAAAIQLPVQAVSYVRLMPLHAEAAGAVNLAAGNSFLPALAGVVCPAARKINLLPEEIKIKRALEDRLQALLKTGVFSLLLAVMLSGFFLTRLYVKALTLERLRREVSRMSAESDVLVKALERLRIIKAFLRERGQVLQVICALADILPQRVFLSDVKLDAQNTLMLKGSARAMSDVFSFVASLEQSEFFRNVQTNYTSARKQDGEDWADFGISCVVLRPAQGVTTDE